MTTEHVGFVKAVYAVAFVSGPRWDVVLKDGSVLETWDPLVASLCDRAQLTHRAIRLVTNETRFGARIVDGDLLDEPQERAS